MASSAFEPLLGGESSRAGRKPFNRRSDAIAYGSPYQKAAALVDLAEDGSGLPEQILELPNIETAAKFYFIFIRFDIIWTLNYFALIALNFFEQPLWCSSVSQVSCSNRDYYYLGELPYLTNAESLAFEGVTLIILVVIALLILTADLVVDILYLSPVAIYSLPLRIAPYIRVVFFILNIRDLRDSLVVLGGMVGTYLNVLALWLLFLLFSSWLAYVILKIPNRELHSFFLTLLPCTRCLFFLPHPTIQTFGFLPTNHQDGLRFFFVLYVLLGVYFVTNLVLAVVYDSFKAELVKQVCSKDEMRTRILRRAFDLIVKKGTDYLDKEQCIELTLPKISKEDFELIFSALDDSGDFKINAEEFNDLCNAIALKFQKEDTEPWLKKFVFYNSSISEALKNFVKSTKFGYVVAFVLLLNLAAVITETTLDIQNNSGQKFWQKVEFVFGWIYVLEMALKVYTYGFENYWEDSQNQFDFIVTWVIVIGETATFVSPTGLTFISNGEWIRYLLIARMLRLIRLLMHVQRYRAFVATFLTLIPSLMPYLGTVFCVMCIYCTLGIQIFGGIVNAGNPDLPATDLADSDYLLFNFNDFPNGMVTLFNLLVMGNWQIWMQDYVALTGTSWTYAYFVSFYLITVLFLLNLIVAFVLEAFFAELELECPEEEEGKKIGVRGRRNMGTKTRSQRVDMLLHHMLSSELHHSPPSSP
ncbi:putative EF-hand domain, Ion transport domain, EF-hand domain pair protein [Helianthus annuus]|nr:putative EF-hand domain, Ion transport domain, EF-hand domain pair protein [Helianthus annuus]